VLCVLATYIFRYPALDEERQEILEGDMYDLVKYYGQKIGLELKYQEEDFRNDFELK
jgi:hypothetical protein